MRDKHCKKMGHEQGREPEKRPSTKKIKPPAKRPRKPKAAKAPGDEWEECAKQASEGYICPIITKEGKVCGVKCTRKDGLKKHVETYHGQNAHENKRPKGV